MKYDAIKKHLKPYSIVAKRKTTINNAFASALAPCDDYNRDRIAEALKLLGQRSDMDLMCVYCDRPAQDWDHLVGLVEAGQLRGFGHQIGNLVPCCSDCNTKKGGKDWRVFLRLRVADGAEYDAREERIACYLERYATKLDLKRVEELADYWRRYTAIRHEILALMKEADGLAVHLRQALKDEA